MPNYHAKGEERMRKLGRQGGLASGEARRLKKVQKILMVCASEMGEDLSILLIYDELRRAGLLKRSKRSGGSHDDDWRCPYCRRFNGIQRYVCAICYTLAPANGRLTRSRLREMAEEHRIAAILRKFELDG